MSMNTLVTLLEVLFITEQLAKAGLVLGFFARPVPQLRRVPELVSILQPVVSGDPQLPAVLAATVTARSSFRREFLWLGDEDDPACQKQCADVMAQHPEAHIRYVALPPAPQGYNPKTFKLATCASMARGDVICVLDDDASLPDDALEQCVPYLDQPGVGVAFGLPYAVGFTNLWSSLTGLFITGNSLFNSLPFAMVARPFTIHGSFYVMRRQTLARIGGFAGLERYLADDFAVAQRVREKGYTLAQTRLRYPLHTHVADDGDYLRLMRRWFTVPRELMMRHLRTRDALSFYLVGIIPSLFPLLMLIVLIIAPTPTTFLLVLVYFVLSLLIFAFNNWRYMGGAVSWKVIWLLPVVMLLTPIQMLAARVLPQRVHWRGNVMQIERGGTFRYAQRRRGATMPHSSRNADL